MCIEKCISGKIVDIVVSNVPRKYAILAGYKIVMNQRSVCTRFLEHSGVKYSNLIGQLEGTTYSLSARKISGHYLVPRFSGFHSFCVQHSTCSEGLLLCSK